MRIAIVGAGFGGLSAAIHLQLAGHDVTLFEAQESVGGRASRLERKGFLFDTGPSLLNYPWVFENLFRSAGRKLEDYVTLLPIDPSITFLWRDGERFTLSSKFDSLVREIERMEPGSGPALTRFLRNTSEQFRISFENLVTTNANSALSWLGSLKWRDLLKLSLFRSFEGELKKYFKNPRIRQALGSYAMYLGGSPFQLPGLFSILPFGELAYGLWLPKGGIYGLVEATRTLAEELGVDIRCSTPVKRIQVENERVTGLLTQDGQSHPFDIVVSNVDVPTTLTRLLGNEGASKPSAKKWRMTPGVITFYWGVRGDIANLPHHSIYLPNDSRLGFAQLLDQGVMPTDLPFYVSAPSKSDPSLAPPGTTLVFVLVPTPVLSQIGSVDWNQVIREARTEVFRRLASHNIRLNESDFLVEEVWTPEEWRNRFGLYDGSAFGAAHTLFQMGPFRAKNYAPDVKGLYFVGASTTPGTGMPMVVLGGAMTAERIKAHAV
jgi:phytoene desaturase